MTETKGVGERRKARVLVHADGREREEAPPMSAGSPVVRKTFRVVIDVEATLGAWPRKGALTFGPKPERYHQALLEGLLRHPELLERLLCSSAVEAARRAGTELEAEHGWGGTSDQELLAELEPDARAYFTEELEDGASVYYFDGYGASVERFGVTEVAKG